MHRAKLIFTALLLAVLATAAYLRIQKASIEADRPRAALDAYLRATYARDFDVAPSVFRRYLRGALSVPPEGSAGSLGRPTAASAEKGQRIRRS